MDQSVGAAEYTDWSLQRGRTPPTSRYDTKQSDAEASEFKELWGMHRTPSLPSVTGPLWPGLVTPNEIKYTNKKELNCVLTLNWTAWNRTTFDIRIL